MAKYRRIFLEEATDHLAEISRALLDLEKEMGDAPAIDTIFRMAHSIKSMAASLGYDPVADLSHRMEDRMEGVRAEGRVRNHEELSLLFKSLESLEAMVLAVANEQDLLPADDALMEALAAESALGHDAMPELADSPSEALAPPEAVGGEPKKA